MFGVLISAAVACGAVAVPAVESTVTPSPMADPASIPSLDPNIAHGAEEPRSASPTSTSPAPTPEPTPTAAPTPTPKPSAPRPTSTVAPITTPEATPEPTPTAAPTPTPKRSAPQPTSTVAPITTPEATPEPTPTATPTPTPKQSAPQPTSTVAPITTPEATPEPNGGQIQEALLVDFVDMAWFSESVAKRVYGDHIIGDRLLFEFRYRNVSDQDIRAFTGVVTFNDLSGRENKSIPLTNDQILPPLQAVTATFNINPALLGVDQWLLDLCGPDFPSVGSVLTCRKSDLIAAFEPSTILFTDGTRLENKTH